MRYFSFKPVGVEVRPPGQSPVFPVFRVQETPGSFRLLPVGGVAGSIPTHDSEPRHGVNHQETMGPVPLELQKLPPNALTLFTSSKNLPKVQQQHRRVPLSANPGKLLLHLH